jgi:hypothetical protein
MSKKNKKFDENETTEMYREFHQRQRKVKKQMRDDRTKSIYAHIVDLEEAGIEVFKLNDYQYRFVKDGHRIDYFPTSGKYHDITINKWGIIPAFKLITLFKG